MKIARIPVYKTSLPYVGGTYVWGAGNAIDLGVTPDFDSLGTPTAFYGEVK